MEMPAFLKKIDLKKGETIVIIVVVIFLIWVLVEFGGDVEGAISQLLIDIGLKKPAVQLGAESSIQQTSQASSNPSSPWSPNLYNANPDASTLDYQTLVNIADNINSTMETVWPFSPDGANILSEFKLLNNQIDVSNLVEVFQQEGYGDLYTKLEMNLTSAQNEVILSQIITFVNSLPQS